MKIIILFLCTALMLSCTRSGIDDLNPHTKIKFPIIQTFEHDKFNIELNGEIITCTPVVLRDGKSADYLQSNIRSVLLTADGEWLELEGTKWEPVKGDLAIIGDLIEKFYAR